MSATLVHRLRPPDGVSETASGHADGTSSASGVVPSFSSASPVSSSSTRPPAGSAASAAELSSFAAHSDFQTLAAHIRINYAAYVQSKQRFLGQTQPDHDTRQQSRRGQGSCVGQHNTHSTAQYNTVQTEERSWTLIRSAVCLYVRPSMLSRCPLLCGCSVSFWSVLLTGALFGSWTLYYRLTHHTVGASTQHTLRQQHILHLPVSRLTGWLEAY